MLNKYNNVQPHQQPPQRQHQQQQRDTNDNRHRTDQGGPPRTNFVPSTTVNSPFPMLFSRSNGQQNGAGVSRPNNTAVSKETSGSANLSSRDRMREIAGKFSLAEQNGSASNLIGSSSVLKGQAVKKLVQRKPAPARPVDIKDEVLAHDTTIEDNRTISRLETVFPNFSKSVLVQAVLLMKNYDDAAEWLSQQDELELAATVRNRSDSPEVIITSKRDIQKPARSIREKFGTTQVSGAINIDSSPVAKVSPKKHQRNMTEDDEELEEVIDINSEDESVESLDETQNTDGIVAKLLDIYNHDAAPVIMDVSNCTREVAVKIIEGRPYPYLDSVRSVDISKPEEPGKKKSKRPRKLAGDKAVDEALETLSGYEAVDSLILECNKLGKSVSNTVLKWGVNTHGSNGELEIVDIDAESDSGVENSPRKQPGGGYFTEQPQLLADDVKLKSYQQVGINWLSLLYKKKLSCILADEMGLGKTCQVISFLAHLKEIGLEGPHLVVVPSSTLENWLREFKRFCPSLVVEPYYGSQKERQELRAVLLESDFDVIVTTYNLACGSPLDTSFLKGYQFNCCIYDEGHMLKNSESERYNKLMKLKAKFRLLLTGTPLQNNLQELISLLAFILPNLFKERKEDLQIIFKHKAKTTDTEDANNIALLSQQRISRAKTMMTPFVLRRKKDQVLQHLPKKIHFVEYCDLCPEQKVIYDAELDASRKVIEARQEGKPLSKNDRSSANVLMTLRKAAVHPLLFRRIYTAEKLRKMSKDIMKEERYYNANQEYIFEDMEVMSDFELHNLCLKFKSIRDYRLQHDEWMVSGKIQKLKEMLIEMKDRGDRILIFSQFTQTLDILESVLSTLDLSFLRLDGQTSVEVRQDLIDKFYEEEDINCFLLSTKAGGFGINLACANVVIIFDMSFNPHDDRQAEDRAHRVGQTREVKVVRLVTKDTIEEAILQLANTKLALDKSVSDESEEAKMEEKNASLVASLIFKK
ncbi:SNF2 family N-terminal domain-containing protein [Lipomyces japonicus]|uniref:SNF2 family N-terminal domain-containing protein n=1 Tax=Lipomyces japonicus TaxID=56871 RepID=UPI0034CFE475